MYLECFPHTSSDPSFLRVIAFLSGAGGRRGGPRTAERGVSFSKEQLVAVGEGKAKCGDDYSAAVERLVIRGAMQRCRPAVRLQVGDAGGVQSVYDMLANQRTLHTSIADTTVRVTAEMTGELCRRTISMR
jgi:hypothetical protein